MRINKTSPPDSVGRAQESEVAVWNSERVRRRSRRHRPVPAGAAVLLQQRRRPRERARNRRRRRHTGRRRSRRRWCSRRPSWRSTSGPANTRLRTANTRSWRTASTRWRNLLRTGYNNRHRHRNRPDSGCQSTRPRAPPGRQLSATSFQFSSLLVTSRKVLRVPERPLRARTPRPLRFVDRWLDLAPFDVGGLRKMHRSQRV